MAWEPTNDEIDLLKKNPKRKRVEPGSTIGESVCIDKLLKLTTMCVFVCVASYPGVPMFSHVKC